MRIRCPLLIVGLAAASPLTMHRIGACDQCGRPPQGQPGSWCSQPPQCEEFQFDTAHLQGPDLATMGCAVLACNSTVYCLKGTLDRFAATDPAVPPCYVLEPGGLCPSDLVIDSAAACSSAAHALNLNYTTVQTVLNLNTQFSRPSGCFV
eukprot:Hpha_TRINITY_DN34392_c0_g1::TRINITY_DN34392_c0_g1_i1::g.109585::m.109585